MAILVGAQPVIRRRFEPGAYDSQGEWAVGVSVDVPISASVQAADGQTLQILEEADRQRDPRCIHTGVELQVTDPRTSTTSDHILWKGRTYQVHKITQDFDPASMIPHTEAIILRIQEGQP